MKKIILFMATCLAAATASSADLPPPPVLQFRLVHETPTGDSESKALLTRDQNYHYTEMLNVDKSILLDQTAVKSAKAVTDALGQPVIDITMTESGAKLFADITKHHLHQRLAVILDGRLCEAPLIQTEISGGEAQISGHFSQSEANDLAMKIMGASVKK